MDDDLEDISSFLGGDDGSSGSDSDTGSGLGSLLSSGLSDASGLGGIAQDLGLGSTAATTPAALSSSTILIAGGALVALVLLA